MTSRFFHHGEDEEQQDAALGRIIDYDKIEALRAFVSSQRSLKTPLKAIQATAFLAATLLSAMSLPAAADGDTLSVCLNEDLPPLSVHPRGNPGSGFDVDLARAVAKELEGRFGFNGSRSRSTRIPSPALEANALLSEIVARWSGATVFH